VNVDDAHRPGVAVVGGLPDEGKGPPQGHAGGVGPKDDEGGQEKDPPEPPPLHRLLTLRA
jgi:hypothetical protein